MSAREAALRDAARALEELRTENPMNGDGSNYMLDRALKALDRLAGDSGPSDAATVVRQRLRAEREARYVQLEAENARRMTSPTSPAPVPSPTADEHDDRPGAPSPAAPGWSASQT